MRKKVCTFIELINGFMLLAGLAVLLSILVNAFTHQAFLQQFLLIYWTFGSIYAVILIADRVSKGLLLYLLICLGGLALTLLIPMSGFTRFVGIFVATAVMIIAISSRVKEKPIPLRRPNAVLICFYALIYLLTLILPGVEVEVGTTISYYLTFVGVILFVIYKNFGKLEMYLTTNQFVQNIPTSQIDRTNTGTLSVFVIFMTALMIFLPMTKVGYLFTYLWQGLKYLLSLLIHPVPSDIVDDGSSATGDPPANSDGGFDIGEEKPTPPWLAWFYEVMTYVMIGLIGLLILIALIVLIVRLVRKFYRPYRENEDVQEFIASKDDEKGSTLPKLKDILKRPDWLDFSPNAVVRRAFRKTILKGSTDTPSKAMTPAELEAFAGLPAGEETDLLHMLYEKARYTGEGVTKEEAKLLKNRA